MNPARELLAWLVEHAEAHPADRDAARELLDLAHPPEPDPEPEAAAGPEAPPEPDAPPAAPPPAPVPWPVPGVPGGGSQ